MSSHELILRFTSPPNAVLIETKFNHPCLDKPIRAILGAYDHSFRWTKGVKAAMLLMLRHKMHCDANSKEANCSVEGNRPSLASTLNDVLTARPRWLYDVFGRLGSLSTLNLITTRWNSDFKTAPSAPVRISIEHSQLPPSSIVILGVDNAPLSDTCVKDILKELSFGAQLITSSNSSEPAALSDHQKSIDIHQQKNVISIQSKKAIDAKTEAYNPQTVSVLLKIKSGSGSFVFDLDHVKLINLLCKELMIDKECIKLEHIDERGRLRKILEKPRKKIISTDTMMCNILHLPDEQVLPLDTILADRESYTPTNDYSIARIHNKSLTELDGSRDLFRTTEIPNELYLLDSLLLTLDADHAELLEISFANNLFPDFNFLEPFVNWDLISS